MSLINEALRKARQAASEREAQQPKGAFRPTKAYPSRRSGREGRPLVVASVAVAAAVLGAAAAWWFLGQGQSAPTEAVISDARSHKPAAPLAAEVDSPTPVVEQSMRDTTEGPVAEVAVLEPPRIVDEPELVPVAADEAPEAATFEETTTDADGDRVFIVEAELGYATLSLGFIVARSANPFAEINGVEVWVGSEIEGFIVEAIEADRVVLRDDKGPLILRVP